MDLRPRAPALAPRSAAPRLPGWLRAGVLAAPLVAAACSSDAPYELGADTVSFPATALDAYRVAATFAKDWSPNAYPARLGGDFTVFEADGTSRNHSFLFYARDGFTLRELTVHLFSGAPYTFDRTVTDAPGAFPDFESLIDSDVAIALAVNVVEAWNLDDRNPPVEITRNFAARIGSWPVWPLKSAENPVPEDIAWRVDFLIPVEVENETPKRDEWWSVARVYLDPESGEALGDPVLPRTGRERYNPSDLAIPDPPPAASAIGGE